MNIYLVQEQYLCCGRTEQLRSECEQHGSLGNIIQAGILRAAGGGGGEEVVMFAWSEGFTRISSHIFPQKIKNCNTLHTRRDRERERWKKERKKYGEIIKYVRRNILKGFEKCIFAAKISKERFTLETNPEDTQENNLKGNPQENQEDALEATLE